MKVLIFGLGLNEGGVGSARFFAKKGDQVRVTDLKSAQVLKPSLDSLKQFPEIEYTLGKHKYEDVDWADLIIKNPAVKPGNPYIDYALRNGKHIETDMGIFLQYVKPSQIIGVTGTKGKSTVASLIYEILSKHPRGEGLDVQPAKHPGGGVLFAGNIGKSVLNALEFIKPDTLVILEISSFQLDAFKEKKVSPKLAVITNIYPDHLNYYQNMGDYVASKKIIAEYQTKDDFLFIRKNDPVTDTEEFLDGIKSQIIKFSANDLPKDFQPTLPGQHNLENIAAAYSVSKTIGIPENDALKTLSSFKGVEFRMQLIYDKGGIKIYNDTTATTPEAAIQAIKSLGANLIHPPGELILITGGMNKGLDYSEFAKVISSNVKNVFFLEGDATNDIIKKLSAINHQLSDKIHGPYNNLMHVLQNVRSIVKKGDIVLFSPAATSFNLFQNEFDRGRKFNEAVERVFK